jgi:hypothetical protein
VNIAWFRAALPDPATLLDETAPVIAALRVTHHLDVITAAEAHDFVWRHFRAPYDVCVYELGHTPAHRFIRAYLPHYPGVVAPRGLGVAPAIFNSESEDRANSRPEARTNAEFTLGLLDPGRLDLVERAARRARDAGMAVGVITDEPARVLRDADLIVATEWPPARGAPTAALLGMAAVKPVVVLEVEATAGWPALDPQTWQPRGWSGASPIVVSIDPRDEEHSLLLAVRRLAADAPLRARLAAAGHAWWREHATIDHAVRAWEQLLADAAATAAPPRHGQDHSDGLRATLAEFGVQVDFL